MTSTVPAAGPAALAPARNAPRAGTGVSRDRRLDAARGACLLIIFVSHVPGNGWGEWIPARFGFSDATEIFVFCSGVALAIAAGGTFARAGWWLGTARVVHRAWQVYRAHVGLFLAVFAMLAAADLAGWNPGHHHVGSLNLWRVLETPAEALVGVVTLRWVPNYFDILPMYLVLLAMVPAAVGLARVSPWLAIAASALVWLLAQRSIMGWLGLGTWQLRLPAEPWSDRTWFLNPFGWQLVFFTGFALARGWLPRPRPTPALAWAAAAVLLGSLALSSVGFRLWEIGAVKAAYVAATGCAETGFGACNPVFDWRDGNPLWWDKTDLSILHYAHFMALAYLAWALAGPGGMNLAPPGDGPVALARAGAMDVLCAVGRQSLAVFVASMVLSQAAGIALNALGRDPATTALVNLAGLSALVLYALAAGWVRSQPWRAAA